MYQDQTEDSLSLRDFFLDFLLFFSFFDFFFLSSFLAFLSFLICLDFESLVVAFSMTISPSKEESELYASSQSLSDEVPESSDWTSFF